MYKIMQVFNSRFILCVVIIVLTLSLGLQSLHASPRKKNNPSLRVSSNEPLLYFFGYVPLGNTSISRTIRFSTQDVTSSLTISCPAGFELSKNNNSFTTSIQYTAAELSQDMTCYVRFRPTEINKGYGGTVSFGAVGVQVQRPDLSGSSLPESLTLDVVNWNLEWFGGSLGPSDDDRQMFYAGKVMDSMNADIYVLQEIVDTARLGALARSLQNGPYDYAVSLYASNSNNQLNGNWSSGQKLAFIYRKTFFSNVISRGFTQFSNRSDNSYNWANGRFPFLLESNVTIDGITKKIIFLSVHGKAELGDYDDYLRRKGASDLMYDSLNFVYPTNHVLIAGDYNDDLDQTISSRYPGSPTPYIAFMNDQFRYSPLSYWNTIRGDNSYIGYPNMVDHSIASNEMQADYVPFSCVVRKDVETLVPFYSQDLSDHYPIQSRFYFRQSSINQVTPVTQQVRLDIPFRTIYVNGKPSSLIFERGMPRQFTIECRNNAGQLIWKLQRTGISAGTVLSLPSIPIANGVHHIILRSDEGVFVSRVLQMQ